MQPLCADVGEVRAAVLQTIVLSACIAGKRFTCNFGFERAAHDVLWSAVLDGDEIVAWCHGRVGDLVALRTLHAVHLGLGGPVDGHRQGTGPGVAGVHHKLGRHAYKTQNVVITTGYMYMLPYPKQIQIIFFTMTLTHETQHVFITGSIFSYPKHILRNNKE